MGYAEAVDADVIVIGSGGAGLLAACVTADVGRSVIVLEKAPTLGGTTAVSGGMLWVPVNPLMSAYGVDDSPEDALCYLELISAGTTPRWRIEQFVKIAPEMVRYLLDRTPVRLFPIDRPDYRSEWPGARTAGRTLDNEPFETARRPGLLERIRRGAHFPALTYQERHQARWAGSYDHRLVAERVASGVLTLGGALVAALTAACDDRGVRFITKTRAKALQVRHGRVIGVCATHPAGEIMFQGRQGVVLASGGFEWNAQLRRAFLGEPDTVPISPPGNEGDGLLMALREGAALDSMTQAWWAPTVSDPDERYDGEPTSRHLVGERCLPGSIMVNRDGMRFVNEATNYNDITKMLRVFDLIRHEWPNLPAWLVFDEGYRRRYTIGMLSPADPPPAWFVRGDTPRDLAIALGIDPGTLTATVSRFNTYASNGVDPDFNRGQSAHDRYYGDDRFGRNPCLGPLVDPPYYGVSIRPGALGTKGGLVTDSSTQVLRQDGSPIPGLFACGNVAATMMGPGYPGSGGTLGPALTAGFRCGTTIGEGTQL